MMTLLYLSFYIRLSSQIIPRETASRSILILSENEDTEERCNFDRHLVRVKNSEYNDLQGMGHRGVQCAKHRGHPFRCLGDESRGRLFRHIHNQKPCRPRASDFSLENKDAHLHNHLARVFSYVGGRLSDVPSLGSCCEGRRALPCLI